MVVLSLGVDSQEPQSVSPRQHYSEWLSELREAVLRMGTAAEGMVADAVEALCKRNTVLGQDVADRDSEIDRMELEIHSTAMVIIVREQPVARDLRLIASAMSIAVELESIGDDAVSIAKKAITILEDIPSEYINELRVMDRKSRAMLLSALRAFATDDEKIPDEVIASDYEVDEIWKRVRRGLKGLMRDNPDWVDAALKLIQAFHHLEYVADHAVSIAERLEFVRTGNLTRFNRAQI